MSNNYKIIAVEKPSRGIEKHNLLNALGKFKVGDLIEFTEIGRVVRVVSVYGSTNLEVEVDLLEDTYSNIPPALPTVNKFECQKCFQKFDTLYRFDLHYASEHKRKSKPKTGGKDGNSKTKTKSKAS